MHNRVFHQARIAGITFEGISSADGPYISSSTASGVALGVSALRDFQPEALGSRHAPPSGWWVVKYHVEERIFLPHFDRDAIRELSDEFGLMILADGSVDPSDRVRQHYFFTSPAWEGLRQWATEHAREGVEHPRLARRCASYDPYLPRWYERAIIEAGALSASPPPLRTSGRGTAWL
jgi:hypothetical protein